MAKPIAVPVAPANAEGSMPVAPVKSVPSMDAPVKRTPELKRALRREAPSSLAPERSAPIGGLSPTAARADAGRLR